METETREAVLEGVGAEVRVPEAPAPEAGARLAQGMALESAPGGVKVLVEGRVVTAAMALGYVYAPQPGDLLLLIGQEGLHFVIGVIHGTGSAVLAFPGDVDLQAPAGRMRLFAAKGVAVHSPEVSVKTGSWTLLTDTLVEKAADAYRFVKGLLSLRAGSRHEVVEGRSFEKADRIYLRAENEVNVDGKTIQLG
ncbi:MAG: DUF3540 domain-containing protein [Planctomycetes bacterium]|nr:DUF3540 domain-containing protein [Planctomycetota bacterium]